MSNTVIAFPGVVRTEAMDANHSEAEINAENVKRVLNSFKEREDNFDEVLIIGISPAGAISWGSSSDDIRSILWLNKAMERILMDTSLGLNGDD